MSVFTRFALRSLARNRSRTVVSIFGITLSCALICAVLTTVVSMAHMLEERTVAEEGAWQVEIAGITQEGAARLASDERISALISVAELGGVDLGEENAADFGRYSFVKTYPENPDGENIIVTPEIESGRAPEAPGEVILPSYFEGAELSGGGLTATGTIELGSTISLALGERTIIYADGSSYVGTSIAPTYFDDAEEVTQELTPTETLEGLRVVGFYCAWGSVNTLALQGNCLYVYCDEDMIEQALTDGSKATSVFTLATVHAPADARAIADEFGQDGALMELGAQTHESLLRWQGVTQESLAWNSLYQVAGVLAAVIAVASISLVYNAFAISVAERTKQFGLLASLGASKRQLRRTVLAEALLLSAVSIPLGLALGIMGCLVVFHVTGTGLASLFDLPSQAGAISVVVSPAVLLVSAALALLTVLVSAWIPALRASRVSAVDAIRQTQDVKMSRRARRAQRRARRRGTDSTQRSLGLAGALFGVPGFMAHRNLSRFTSKGRVTVVALAVSVALLIISASIGGALTYSTELAAESEGGVDLSVSINPTAAESADGTLVRENGEVDVQAFRDALERLYQDACERVSPRPLGYYTRFIADVIVPASLCSPEASSFFGTTLADGSWSGPVYVNVVDDATWASYIDELGLSAEEFSDPTHPQAVLLNNYSYSNVDGSYGAYSPLAEPGDIETVTYAAVDGMYAGGIYSDENGEPYVWFSAPDGTECALSLDDGLASRSTLTVGALADEAPLSITSYTNTMQLVLPASALAAVANASFGDTRIDFDTAGSADGAIAAQEAFEGIAAAYPELDCTYTNLAQQMAQARMMSGAVQTFIYCFTVVTGLIAVANAFNTLTTSLILRRREFAVLKSIGMGDASFRRMIAYECASYALRGLALGFALALIVHTVLYRVVIGAFTTYSYTIPWLQAGCAAGIVLLVILASAAYALHRSHASSVVDALRDDAI